jgi:hypothetical protein
MKKNNIASLVPSTPEWSESDLLETEKLEKPQRELEELKRLTEDF